MNFSSTNITRSEQKVLELFDSYIANRESLPDDVEQQTKQALSSAIKIKIDLLTQLLKFL